ncbi:MAG TPA: carboxypeptidase regulatory-like domain-containing protein [Tenuifilaceae bacterium]|nr:carboxypeptidase regulatory-like domain-containing protein [Tenuifilaceae bacterium]HRX69177.1 carboxypeptidase regulatory-like domain-containing protein [Tenuifilaceae bacterium]
MRKYYTLLLLFFIVFSSYSQRNKPVSTSYPVLLERLDKLDSKREFIDFSPVSGKSNAYTKELPSWIHWDDGENNSAIGTNDESEFDVAARFEPSDMEELVNGAITKIRFYPNEEQATYTLKIWQGVTPTEVYSQEVTSPIIGSMNVVDLNEPVEIDITQDLWIGYNVVAQTGYPAGCDAGPPVVGKGNMIAFEGEWFPLNEINPELTYNWNIQAYIELLVELGAPEAPSHFVLEPDANGNLTAQITWTNPALSIGGESLAELQSVQLFVAGSSEPIYVNNNPEVGGDETYTFIPETDNLYRFLVSATNSVGEGLSASVDAWIGTAIPAAPGDVSLTPQGDNGLVTWQSPEAGLYGGYFLPENTTFSLVRLPDNIVVAENISETQFLDVSIPGINNYQYIVTANNNIGVGGSASSNVALLAGGSTLLYETFSVAPVGGIPVGWSVQGFGERNWSVKHTDLAGGSAPEIRLFWSPTFEGQTKLVSAPVNITGTSNLRLNMNHYLSNYALYENTLAVCISFDAGETWTNLWEHTIVGDIESSELEFFFPVPQGATSMLIGWEFNGDVFQINNWNIDNVILVPVLNNDLEASFIKGNAIPNEGQANLYTIRVKNTGNNEQSEYSVKLMREGGTILASAPGESLACGEYADFQLEWTPSSDDIGKTSLYGVVEIANDQVPDNNQTEYLNLNIQKSNVISVDIANDKLKTDHYPFDFYYKNSLCQTIYQADEIELIGGEIQAIVYYNKFSSQLLGKRVKIWMGNTLETSLANNWVSHSSLSLVFDGTIDFPNGEYPIVIPLQIPFTYDGGNIVVQTNRVWEDFFASSNDAFFGEVDELLVRTRYVASDNQTPIDPSNPGEGTAIGWVPFTSFLFGTEGLGFLEGTVTDGENPLEGVMVSIGNMKLKTYTNENGDYSISYLPPNYYDVEFDLYGYKKKVESNVVIREDLVTEVNVNLEEIPLFSFSGVVYANDDTVLEGAIIELSGYDNYTLETSANGGFTFDEVFEGQYMLTVSAPGYESYIDSEFELTENTEQDITLVEIIELPFRVRVDVNQNNALLSWNNLLKLYQHDGYVPSQPSAHYQRNTRVYGTVFDLVDYPDATLKKMDFHHKQWDVPVQSFEYLVHIVDWMSFTILKTIGPLNTTVNDAWENDISLNDFESEGRKLIAVMIQPLGYLPNDAYPCVTTDVTGPGGLSVYAEVNDLSNYAINSSSLGDFFINLWIATENDAKSIYKAPGFSSSRIEEITSKTGASISSSEVKLTQLSLSLNSISKGFVGYNVYLNNQLVTTQPVAENEFLFENLTNGEYTAGVQSVYTSDSSKVVKAEFTVFFVDVEVNQNQRFKVYPNPFTSSIRFANLSGIETITIHNIIGVELAKIEVNGNSEAQLQTQNLPKGIYVVVLTSENGEKFAHRMIKK